MFGATELEESPGIQLSTPCSAFDAVTVPPTVGLEVQLLLGCRDLSPVPCLTKDHDHVVFLVRARTGSTLAEIKNVSAESGSGGRLVLPPSSGGQWDTPPWEAGTEAQRQLTSGTLLAPCIRDALQLHERSSP